ncbi:hypothetical protein GCM10025789_24790 [Tessaracoccus lubricantis]|uniref:DUF1707 domain-containing protein n=1 Tax=Tessaracoccus lubricantis TaxID=545543 RepID=A0ABP9FKL8_9ACTN
MPLPPSSKYLQRANDPVDETERSSITQRLNDAFADGRLTHDEYAAAMDVVYDARTLGDLVPVMEKLPAAATSVPAIVEQGGPPAGQVSEARSLVPVAALVGIVGVSLVAVLIILLLLIF